MLFNSFIFIIFLCVVVPLALWLPRRPRNVFLLIASYFFYGYWDWRFLSLLFVSTIIDYVAARAIAATDDPRRRKRFLLLSLASNLGLLGTFKYFNFFVDSFARVAAHFGTNLDFLHLNIILPVGISFYTFQTLSYTIDVYRGKMAPTRNLLNFALYVAFFPQLVAGPIERAIHLLPQVENMRRPSRADLSEGMALITVGMFRKVIIGDTCGRYVDHIFSGPTYYSSSELLSALLLFSLQIYADFSGYSSIARGTARLLGVDLMENFNQPYLAANITEFWRRWHISLSTWLRDYLYIPLGGNRKGPKRTYVNLFATMLLGGLWHGANWTFVFWGGLHGGYLAVHKFMLKARKPDERLNYTGLASLLTFVAKVTGTYLIVLLAWLFFRSRDFTTAFYILKKIVAWSPGGFSARFAVIVLTYSVANLVLDLSEYVTRDHAFPLRTAPRFRWGIYLAAWTIIFMYMFQAKPMPFIYFQF
ncbi:MAG TPA: MBOAT family O-acyltransferase [Candidatus Krumholzibacteria bacterium]|nr:MBOAT family O-acyltransferase [Candidatus Krumholzibacteria bacterium]